MTIVIGLSGPIGCGKSTVAGTLARLGATAVDADELARDVVEVGQPAHDAVVDAFGPTVVDADGSLDRATLARRVFDDRRELARLEAIVHPAVRPRIEAAIAAARASGAPAVVIEAIKLVESGLADACDEVWLVTCDRDAQAARLRDRGLSAADAARRVRAQRDLVGRLRPRATRVIDTSGSLETSAAAVEAAYRAALATADRAPGRRGPA